MLAAALAACGGSGSGPGSSADGSGGGGGTIAPATRDADVAAITQRLQSLLEARDADVIGHLVAFARTLPGVEDAGANPDDTAWVRFADGKLHFVMSSLAPLASAGSANASAATARLTRAAAAASPFVLPVEGARSVWLGQTFPLDAQGKPYNPGGQELVSRLSDWFSRRGYRNVAAAGKAGVDDFEAISGAEVLFLIAHAGEGRRRDGTLAYCALTTTPKVSTPHLQALYDAGELATATAVLDYTEDAAGKLTAVTATSLCFTSTFVARIQLAKHALVLLNLCSSQSAAAQAMIAAFQGAGADVVAGWDDEVSPETSYPAAAILFDRLLGTNQADPKPQPLVRPFDWQGVLDHLRSQQLDTGVTHDSKGIAHTAHLVATAPPAPLGLVPGIRWMEVRETADGGRLLLHGAFGPDPGDGDGQVTVGGAVVPATWSADGQTITAQLTASGPGSDGEVQVTSGKRGSNVLHLTSYRGHLDYTEKPIDVGRPTKHLAFDVHLRVDLHRYRDRLDDVPIYPTAAMLTAAGISPLTSGAADSVGAADFSGWLTVKNDPDCPETTTWRGVGPVGPFPPPGQATGNVAIVTARVDDGRGHLLLALGTGAGLRGILQTDVADCNGDPGFTTSPDPEPLAFGSFGNTPDHQWVALPLGDDLSAPDGTYDGLLLSSSGATVAHATLSWTDFAPVAGTAPDDVLGEDLAQQ